MMRERRPRDRAGAPAIPRRLARPPGLWGALTGGLWALGVGVPPVLVAHAIASYGINLPYWDEWELVPYLEKLYSGHLGLGDLWTQHNEHRILFPRILLLSLARLTDWNIVYELYANLAVAVLIVVVLGDLLRITVGRIAPGLSGWLALPVSLFTFSLGQWENWTFGWQVCMFLNVLGAVVAVWALARWPGTWRGLALASLAAAFAALSFASGLALLAVVPLGVLLGGRGRRARLFLGSAAVAALLGALYLSGYEAPGAYPGFHPIGYGAFFLAYLGTPVGGFSVEAAVAFGFLGVAALGVAAGWLWRREMAARAAITPWILLAAYPFLSAAMTGGGRAGWGGVEQAIASRYTTISGLFWISVVVVGGVLLAVGVAHRPVDSRALAATASASALVTLMGVGYAITFETGYRGLEGRRLTLVDTRECVLNYRVASEDCLKLLYELPLVRDRAAVLEALKLGPFAAGRSPARTSTGRFHGSLL